MIRSPLHAGLALACALSLSSCGGGKGDLYISGTVVGITKAGLVLTNNGGDDLAVNSAGTFTFSTPVERDSGYKVEVKTLPLNVDKDPNKGCKVTNGSGKAVFNVTNVLVTCQIQTHALGGTIIGLAGAPNLVLVNGSDRKEIVPAAVGNVPPAETSQPFDMTPVSEGIYYGISILRQPDGRTCTVENPSGTMQESDVKNIVVKCTQ